MPIRFDESLEALFELVKNELGNKVAEGAAYVRDATGRLSAVVPIDLDNSQIERFEAKASEVLGGYVRSYRSIFGTEDDAAHRLLLEMRHAVPVPVAGRHLAVIDRRIVGVNWLERPAPAAKGPPRFVFASVKGGVGRSTALSVIAAHLSRTGQRVLAVDLDLEAPGIGSMLLSADETPRFGALDYLVENGISGIDETFIADAIGNSFLGSAGARVAVMPAIGAATLANPTGTLSKLARAYLEDIQPLDEPIPLAVQMREMIDRLADTGQFDVILVDARAGLHETTATAILGLGAEVLLFGIDEPQTFLGYRLLLAHVSALQQGTNSDWKERATFVLAKSNHKDPAEAAQRLASLLDVLETPVVEEGSDDESLDEDDFDLDWDDDPARPVMPLDERTALVIKSDERFAGFDPLSLRATLNTDTYADSYAELLQFVEGVIAQSRQEEADD